MRLFRIWLRPGGGIKNDISSVCLRDNVILLGWHEIALDPDRPISRDELREKVKKYYASGYVADQFVCFFKTMEESPRSLVLVPATDGLCYIGEITGPVESRSVEGKQYYCRPVRWVGRRARVKLSGALQTEVKDQHTCREITNEGCKKEVGKIIGTTDDTVEEQTRNAGGHRKPVDLSSQLSSYEYLVKGGRRVAFRPHKEFQTRLESYLHKAGASKVVSEMDFIDVSFSVGRQAFIGEVKVTNGFVSPHLAFRAALAQVLDYRFGRVWNNQPRMVIFLDRKVDEARLALAARLEISVVVETVPGGFRLSKSRKHDPLHSIFPPLF
jgi:hypothetical protein